MQLVGFLLATLVGLSLGLLGAGGSILTVPILVYLLGFGAKTAIAMSLPIVGTTSLIGALGHWRAGNVRPRAALLFGAAAMAGSFGGARLAAYLSGAAQLTILAVVMLVAAVSMYRGGIGGGDEQGDTGRARAPVLLVAVGAGVGVLTGVVGIGGGFLIVPALVLLVGVPMKQAVGTSLLVIALNSASGSAGYLGRVAVPWDFIAVFAGMAILGILAGTALVRHVPQARLTRVFALFLASVGLFTLCQNRTVFGADRLQPAAAASVAPRAGDRSSALGRA